MSKAFFLDTTLTFVNQQFFKKAVAAIIMNISKEKNMKMFLSFAESVEKVRQEVSIIWKVTIPGKEKSTPVMKNLVHQISKVMGNQR